MRTYQLLSLLLLVSFSANSQSEEEAFPERELSIELLGSNLLYSFNYEKLLHRKERVDYRISVGFHFNPYRFNDYRSLGVNVEPKMVYYFDGQNSLVLGAGYTYFYLFDDKEGDRSDCCAHLSLLVGRVGYRRYIESKPRYWGVSFNPIYTLAAEADINEWENPTIMPHLGIQYGWGF